MIRRRHALAKLLLASLALTAVMVAKPVSAAKINVVEITQKTAEGQIRHLVEPLLDKYCRDQCKLLNIAVSVDMAIPDEVAPGFDDISVHPDNALAPTSARIKVLMDDKVGPISRGKLVELIQQYLETLDYPVTIDTQIAHFPQPVGSDAKVAELRERISRQFQNTIAELIQQFCPEQCLLADFALQTDVVNTEESQYGTPGEFVQEGGVALKIKDISGTILVDDSLLPEERANVLEMAKLKTNTFRHVSLTSKAMKFPKPTRAALLAAGGYTLDRRIAGDPRNPGFNDKQTSENKKTDSTTANRTESALNNTTNKNSSLSTNEAKSTNEINNSEQNTKRERFERIEKIERVENGDAVQAELQKFKFYGLIFGCSILSLLIFIAMANYRPRKEGAGSTIHRVIQNLASDPLAQGTPAAAERGTGSFMPEERTSLISKRYEIERLIEELSAIFAQQPRVAKHVFSRILTEEGVETTAKYIHIFGESIVVDMLRDPSLQADLSELMEYYAKTPQEVKDDEKLDLLRRLHNRAIAGKLVVLGNRSSNLFDFLAEMDSTQILEMIRTESLTVKAIILTQCDTQKRGAIYAHLDEDVRMKLLAELSRIDYLPRDYIFNVSNALKRKRRDNPKLNTEALPGSEVLVTLLERTGTSLQRTVVKNLEVSNPDSARTIKSKLVSIETLRYLRDGQMLEVVLSLKHDELLQFLKGSPAAIRNAIFAKSPKELVVELEEELVNVGTLSREAYQAVERKVLNRMKLMANEGLVNLVETNERMFSESEAETGFVGTAPQAVPPPGRPPGGAPPATDEKTTTITNIKKVSGW